MRSLSANECPADKNCRGSPPTTTKNKKLSESPDGVSRPLKQMYQDLSVSGTAVVTVPFLSLFRKIKYLICEGKKWDKTKYMQLYVCKKI